MIQEQDAGWLAAMQYDEVYRPLFTTLPENRADRWRLMEEFISLWHKPLTRNSGNSEEEIEQAEARLGVKLPAALCEWYQLAGKRTGIWSKQDHLLELGRMNTEQEHGNAIVFRNENQGCERWGILSRDLGEADPPVTELLQSIAVSRVSQLAIQTLFLETMWCGTVGAHNEGGHSQEADHALKEGLTRSQLPDGYWVLYPLKIYEGRDIFVVESLSDGFSYIAARTKARFEALPDIVVEEFTTFN